MSRRAERLEARHADAENAEMAKTPAESQLEGSFGNSGEFGIGTCRTDLRQLDDFRGDAAPLGSGQRPDAHDPATLWELSR